MRLGDDRRAQLGLVERAEPLVVIAGHDRQRAPLAPELGQGPQAFAAQRIVVSAARAHPEVAKIADDHQGIVARQSAQPGAEAAVAIGSIISQVNIAGEVMRHGRNILAVSYSWSGSPNKRPARRVRGRAVGQVLRGSRGARCSSRRALRPGAAGAGPEPEIGKSRALPRGMNLGKMPRGTDRVARGLDREMRLIALSLRCSKTTCRKHPSRDRARTAWTARPLAGSTGAPGRSDFARSGIGPRRRPLKAPRRD